MRIHELDENLGNALIKGAGILAPKVAPLTLGQKLRSIVNNMPSLDHLDPSRVPMHYDQLLYSLRRIAQDDPKIDSIVKFMQSQQNNPQLGQVLQMVIKQLREIPGV